MRVRLQTLQIEGFSQSVMAKHLGIALGTVKRWCKQLKANAKAFLAGPAHNHGGNPYSRRPAGELPLSKRDKDRIVRFVQNKKSLRKLSQRLPREVRLSASRSTLSRVLKNSDLIGRHLSKKPALTTDQRKRRVVFAKSNLERDWSVVLSADEVEVSIDGKLGSHNNIYWAKATTKLPTQRTHKFPTSRKYFVAITAHGALDPVEFTGHLNSRSYQQLLDKALRNANTLAGGCEWVYLHDSAPYHASADTQLYLESHVPCFFSKTEWPGWFVRVHDGICVFFFSLICVIHCRQLARHESHRECAF